MHDLCVRNMSELIELLLREPPAAAMESQSVSSSEPARVGLELKPRAPEVDEPLATSIATDLQ